MRKPLFPRLPARPVVLAALLGTLALGACKDASYSQQAQNHYQKLYDQAVRYGDHGVAIQAAHSLLVLDTTQLRWTDSLSRLYFQSGAYALAARLGEQALQATPKQLALLQRVASAQYYAGNLQAALASFRQVQAMQPSLVTAYRLAYLQYLLGDLDGAHTNAQQLLANPEAGQEVVLFDLNPTVKQAVNLPAACHNLLGKVAQDRDQPTEARQHYQKALELAPKFQVAADNLASLNR